VGPRHARDAEAEAEPDAELALVPGAKLVGADLSDRNLAGVDLSGADLSRANLSGSRLINAKLAGTTLFGARLDRAHLLGADLTGADLTEASCGAAIFGSATLDDAVLFNADLSGATLTDASLVRADLRSARLRDVRLRSADLSDAELRSAELANADLSGTEVAGADFGDASLVGCRLRNVTGFTEAHWVGVDISDVDFTSAYALRRSIMDENYLYEFRNTSRTNALIYQVWRATSDCGRSLVRWGALTLVMALSFALAYAQVDIDYGDYETWLSPFYFSVVTLTTLGYGDVLPASLPAQIVVLAEVLMGYIMLGGLLSIFATKMGRRAE
jgi:uncharacterized protein YjbI with pentapeptide repeats